MTIFSFNYTETGGLIYFGPATYESPMQGIMNTSHPITMKKISLLILIIVTPLLFSNCKKKQAQYELGEQMAIPINKTVTFADGSELIDVKFKELVSESRCPPEVYCFWEGMVTIKIEVNGDEVFEISNITNAQMSATHQITYQDYTLSLNQVSYGDAKNFGKEKHYIAYVTVAKN